MPAAAGNECRGIGRLANARPYGAAVDADEAALEAVLADVEPWRGRILGYRPVPGGISNTNWQVEVEGEARTFFLKMPGRGTEMFIDRAAAAEASRLAEEIGIGPRTYGYLAGRGIEIHDFIEDRRACTNADFLDRDVRASVISVYRTLHGSPRLSLTKTVFDMIDEHVDQARSLGSSFPADSAWLFGQYRLARAALEASGIDLVPSFNDPMPGNFMLGPDKSIMLIDYEYASNNDRCYDLGIWCGEMFFSGDVETEVIERYFGRFDRAMKSRLVVHRALADVKWSTWAMVQDKISALDFDFRKYGVWKHMRARWLMRHPDWQDHLRTV